MSLLKPFNPRPSTEGFITTLCTYFTVSVVGAHYGLFSENSIDHDLLLSVVFSTIFQAMDILIYRKRQRAKKCRVQNDRKDAL